MVYFAETTPLMPTNFGSATSTPKFVNDPASIGYRDRPTQRSMQNSRVIDSQTVQNGGYHVFRCDRTIRYLGSLFVCGPNKLTAADSSPRHED